MELVCSIDDHLSSIAPSIPSTRACMNAILVWLTWPSHPSPSGTTGQRRRRVRYFCPQISTIEAKASLQHVPTDHHSSPITSTPVARAHAADEYRSAIYKELSTQLLVGMPGSTTVNSMQRRSLNPTATLAVHVLASYAWNRCGNHLRHL